MERPGVILCGEVRLYPSQLLRKLGPLNLFATGKRVGERETLIRGGLKYVWATGTSTSGIVERKAPPNSA